MLCLAMPALLDVLVLEGHWQELLALARWQPWLQAMPLNFQAMLEPSLGQHQKCLDTQITPEALEEVAMQFAALVRSSRSPRCLSGDPLPCEDHEVSGGCCKFTSTHFFHLQAVNGGYK